MQVSWKRTHAVSHVQGSTSRSLVCRPKRRLTGDIFLSSSAVSASPCYRHLLYVSVRQLPLLSPVELVSSSGATVSYLVAVSVNWCYCHTFSCSLGQLVLLLAVKLQSPSNGVTVSCLAAVSVSCCYRDPFNCQLRPTGLVHATRLCYVRDNLSLLSVLCPVILLYCLSVSGNPSLLSVLIYTLTSLYCLSVSGNPSLLSVRVR